MKYLVLCFALLIATPAYAADDLLGMYQSYDGDSQAALTSPHRSASELGNWLSDTVADALMFNPKDATRKLAAVRTDFSEQGYKAYLAFLSDQGFSAALQNQTLQLSTIVNSTPLLIGQGASAGRFAWAFEVPVVMTVGQSGVQPQSRNVTLRIQIGRSASGPAPNGVVVESWQVFQEGSGQPN